MGRRKIEPMNPVKKNIVSKSKKIYDINTMKIQKIWQCAILDIKDRLLNWASVQNITEVIKSVLFKKLRLIINENRPNGFFNIIKEFIEK